MAFERGFKTRCENLAASVRGELAIAVSGQLPISQLAEHLDVRLMEPTDIPGMSGEALAVLLTSDSDDWSAVTIGERSSGALMIYNPTHSAARRASDLAHELSHLLLHHTPSTMMFAPDGEWTLRTFNEQQEDEANWLAGCLLLPRAALEVAGRNRWTEAAIAEKYGVSSQMVRYRKSVTGVDRQYSGRAAYQR